jgi:mannonate dehydratase
VSVEADGSFVEAEHLQGDVDLIDIVQVLVAEERARANDPQRRGQPQIALRPDHGRTLEGDIEGRPGYSWLGRLKALAELRGVLATVERLTHGPGF